ncbi:MAG: DUF6034 family protein [Clostridium sp.]|nr:DUF6034 family protein [Clostridium sp.]MCM1398516.1 DUF6034 family protein [Clostridium sp.]MCM1460238.1 DUF6034 family protein [Bacteroides sp.]
MRIKKHMYAGIVMAVFLTSLSSCGKATRDDIAKEFDVIGTGTNAGVENTAIQNHLEYVVQSAGGNTSFTVSADVETNGLENAYVYEAKRKEMNEESLKQLADSFFEGDYTYIKPYVHCSLEELEQEEAFYQQLTDEHGQDIYTYAINYTEKLYTLLNDYNETASSYETHNGLIYHNDEWDWGVDAFFEDMVEFEDFRVKEADYSRLRGEVDGHVYELYYGKYYTEGKNIPATSEYDPERIVIMCVDTPYYLKGCTDMGASSQANACDYNTALSQAEQAVEKLGFKEWEHTDTRQMDVATTAGHNYLGLNGYEFWFYPDMNGKYAFPCRGKHMMAFGSDHDTEWIYATGQPLIRVYVTDNGIEAIDIGDVYDKSDADGQRGELMPFEKIDGIAREFMGNYYLDRDLEITAVKLGYLYISYDGVQFSLVPVWAYCYETGSEEEALVYINALDGELVVQGSEKIFLGYHPAADQFIRETQY